MGMKKNCEYCGESFTPAWSAGNRQRFCGDPCARAWWRENRDKRKQYKFACKNCGKDYSTRYKDRGQYCSRECAYADIDSWRVTPNKAPKEQFICSICGISFTGYKSQKGYCSEGCKGKGNELTCEYCGESFYNKLPFTKYCSLDCQVEANKQMKREQYEPKPYFVTECKECGNEFETNHSMVSYCSDDCATEVEKRSKSEANAKRRARESGAFVSRVIRKKIFERDGWRCRLCGKRVDPKLKFPHLECATLDHILPLANGGTHEPRNVQLAHFICNSTKSNMQPDQLRLL